MTKSFQILGYLLNPCTVIFGPALPFTNYRIAFIPQSLTVRILPYSLLCFSFKAHLYSIFPSLLFIMISFLSLLVSSCFTQILLPEEGILRQFGDAQSFRFSHYFICFWSQGQSSTYFFTTVRFSGLISLGGEESPLIVRPQQVELPRSLTQVVSLWNIPMHQYLFHCKFMNIHKSCIWVNLFTVVILVDVYSRLRQFGSGVSIMGTFFISSLLHVSSFPTPSLSKPLDSGSK